MPSCTQGDCACCSTNDRKSEIEQETEELIRECSELRDRLLKLETNLENAMQKREAEMRDEIKEEFRRKLGL